MKKLILSVICLILMLFMTSCSILKIPYKISPEETQINRENCFNHIEAIVKEYGCQYTRDDTSMQIYIDKSDSVNKESDEIIAFSINNDKNYYEWETDEDYNGNGVEVYDSGSTKRANTLDNVFVMTDMEKLLLSVFLTEVVGSEITENDLQNVLEEAKQKIDCARVEAGEDFTFKGNINNIANAPFCFEIKYNYLYDFSYRFGGDPYFNCTVNSFYK